VDKTTRVINGTFGELWLNGEQVGECYGLQLKMSFNKEDVPVCGNMFVDTKVTSVKGTGTVKLHKVNSRMPIAVGDNIVNGHDKRFVIVSKLKDPDAYGAERVSVSNVSFDDVTLADWEAAKKGMVECPLTFASKPVWLDRIGA